MGTGSDARVNRVGAGSAMPARTPDLAAQGLLAAPPDALRYDDEVDAGEDPYDPCILSQWMPRQVSVLDVGCATGSLTLRMNRGKDNSVLGLEPDAQRAALARARGLEVSCAILDEAFVATAGKFDVVVLADVIEHVAAPAELLRNAGALLRDGGRILASVPNVAHWTVRLQLLFGRFEYASIGIMDATHLRFYTRATLRRLFEAEGFSIVRMRPTAGLWMAAYRRLPFRLLPRRLLGIAIRSMLRLLPGLFACQFVVEAVAA